MLANAIPVDVQRDYLTIAIAALASVSTLLAVLVAIFGRAWQDWRRRPRLFLEAVGGDLSTRYAIDPEERNWNELVPVSLTLRNAQGKDPAREVELFLTVTGVVGGTWTDDPGQQYPKYEQVPLNLGSGRPGHEKRTVATVTPGYSRKLTLALLGDADYFAHERAPWGGTPDREPPPGAFNIAEPIDEEDPLMWPGCLYNVEVAVTGANFDALIFAGRLRAVSFRGDEDEPLGDFWTVRAEWQSSLRRSS